MFDEATTMPDESAAACHPSGVSKWRAALHFSWMLKAFRIGKFAAGVCIAASPLVLTACTSVMKSPHSFVWLEIPERLHPAADPDAKPEFGGPVPLYVQVQYGSEQRDQVGYPISVRRLHELIDGELGARGWCPHSWSILSRTIGGFGARSITLVVKCALRESKADPMDALIVRPRE
jgi:hypothetical protein